MEIFHSSESIILKKIVCEISNNLNYLHIVQGNTVSIVTTITTIECILAHPYFQESKTVTSDSKTLSSNHGSLIIPITKLTREGTTASKKWVYQSASGVLVPCE